MITATCRKVTVCPAAKDAASLSNRPLSGNTIKLTQTQYCRRINKELVDQELNNPKLKQRFVTKDFHMYYEIQELM